MGCAPSKDESKLPDHLIEGHNTKYPILCTALSDDFSLLVTGDESGVVRMYSALSSSIECLAELSGHKVYIFSSKMSSLLSCDLMKLNSARANVY